MSTFLKKKRYEGVRFNVKALRRDGWVPHSQEKNVRNTGMVPKHLVTVLCINNYEVQIIIIFNL